MSTVAELKTLLKHAQAAKQEGVVRTLTRAVGRLEFFEQQAAAELTARDVRANAALTGLLAHQQSGVSAEHPQARAALCMVAYQFADDMAAAAVREFDL